MNEDKVKKHRKGLDWSAKLSFRRWFRKHDVASFFAVLCRYGCYCRRWVIHFFNLIFGKAQLCLETDECCSTDVNFNFFSWVYHSAVGKKSLRPCKFNIVNKLLSYFVVPMNGRCDPNEELRLCGDRCIKTCKTPPGFICSIPPQVS